MKTMKELMSLEGRTALITGGAGHIGQKFAQALAELGAEIILIDIDEQKNKLAIKNLKKYGFTNVESHICDLSKKQSILDTCDTIKRDYNKIDILVNNAAYVGTSDIKGWAAPFYDQSTDCWADALQINLTAAFEFCHELENLLSQSGKGSIINISSIYGLCGPDMSLYAGTNMGNPAAYAASKGGMIQLTRWLSTSLAPKIRVNTISPGGVERGQNPSFIEAYKARTPMGRMATEDDMKGAIVYLASDMSSYVTGQNICVDGGWTAW